MEKKEIITYGVASPEGLSDDEKRAFYVAMLVRILDAHKSDLEGEA